MTRSNDRSGNGSARASAAHDTQPPRGRELGGGGGVLERGHLPAEVGEHGAVAARAAADVEGATGPQAADALAHDGASTGVPPVPVLERRRLADLLLVHELRALPTCVRTRLVSRRSCGGDH